MHVSITVCSNWSDYSNSFVPEFFNVKIFTLKYYKIKQYLYYDPDKGLFRVRKYRIPF